MARAYYSNDIAAFIVQDVDAVLGILTAAHSFSLETVQRDAWRAEIAILRELLVPYAARGSVHFEFTVPRLGKRIDVVVVIGATVFVLEFKVGEATYPASAREQVWDYALDLKNFHETSRDQVVIPVLVATNAPSVTLPPLTLDNDLLARPVNCNTATLPAVIERGLQMATGRTATPSAWERGRYSPTPTIIEAAMALYHGHGVAEISRSDAGATNLTETSEAVSAIIHRARERGEKAICFVTGVPGAGKTLVGLNVATQHTDAKSELHSVFLSGNGPLVAVLREALARDRVRIERERGTKLAKGIARSEVQAFIQNVHHFRDECLADETPPIEHVVLFDEAQRAWNRTQTANFMKRKKGRANFDQSEPEFLISCLDRHKDWAVVVCLVGGGQEINTGEAGISEWIDAIQRAFPEWSVYISDRLTDSEYGAGHVIESVRNRPRVEFLPQLHLSVSMRSFRAENVSLLVKQMLDLEVNAAAQTFQSLAGKYPIVITRDLDRAKHWVRQQARGSERFGLVASSQAQRLKPHAIDVRAKLEPVRYFLDPRTDVRSSYYLEDAATEFHVQGLELDWTCVTWDADLRHTKGEWQYRSFRGDGWDRVQKMDRRRYLLNAYRVLLTRARQGMAIFIPPGDTSDPTRKPEFYDGTFALLKDIGIPEL